jgi:predicted dehydrogenase
MAGLGLVATSHLKGYATHPHAWVSAVCDSDETRARAFAEAHGIPRFYSSYEEMLGAGEIDAVSIATPTYLHAPMSLKAAQAGLHVHCEKPFCRSVGEGLEVCDAGRSRGLRIVVGETYVFISSHVKARELIDAGEIGTPLQVRQRLGDWMERDAASPAGLPADRSWRVDPRQSGGGEYPWLFDHAVHFFATAEYLVPGHLISEVHSVTAATPAGGGRGAAHDPYTTAPVDIPIITFKYDDPTRQGVWMKADRLSGRYDYMRGVTTSVIGDRGVIEVLGEGGHNLIWEGRQQHLVLHRRGKEALTFRFEEGGDSVWQSDISYYGRGHINQVHHFLDCVVKGVEPRYGGEDGVHAVRCTLAAVRSAREERPVRVDEIGPDYAAYT